jgi:hypothetical protein
MVEPRHATLALVRRKWHAYRHAISCTSALERARGDPVSRERDRGTWCPVMPRTVIETCLSCRERSSRGRRGSKQTGNATSDQRAARQQAAKSTTSAR